MHKLEQQLAAQ